MKGFATTAAFAATAATLIAAAANATIVLGNGDSVNLADLMAGEDRRVIIDDKVFTFESVGSAELKISDFRIVGFIASGTHGNGLNNVGFDITGPFGDASPGRSGMSEMNLQYQVAVRQNFYDRGIRISDARLTFNGASGGVGSFARVDETIMDLDKNDFLGNLSTFDNFGPPHEQQLTDGKDFSQIYGNQGYRALEVNKDLKFFAATENGFASASWVRQEFSQIYTPTPGAMALLALAGVTGSRRRRR
jgi:hypothetical protein